MMESDMSIINYYYDRALLHSNGDVYFSSHVVMISSCPVDVTLFPFDIQECNITIGSTVHNSERLVLTTTRTNGSRHGNGMCTEYMCCTHMREHLSA